MLVSGSYWSDWKFVEEIGRVESEALDKMGKDEYEGEDVEEGEISDTASVEEITEEDFKQEAKVSSKPKAESGNGVSAWTTRNMYKYFPAAPGLYNLAWAQAVQNKPLNDIFVMDVDDDDDENSEAVSVSCSGKIEKIVIDDSGDEMDVEKEEGELEEGEIDLDSEPVEEEFEIDNKMNVDGLKIGLVKEEDLEKQVKSIREELESVTAIDAEKSFESVCSQLHNSLEKFQILDFGSNASQKKHLIQHLFTAIEVVNSVFCSMGHHRKEQSKRAYSLLLSFVKSKTPPLFSLDQMKEIEVMMTSLESHDVLLNTETCDIDKVTQVDNGLNMKDAGLTSGGKLTSHSVAMESLVGNKPNMLSELQTLGSANFRGRGLLVPLLDLHKDHDADSLPSPTREAPPSFSMHKTLSFGDGIHKMEPARPNVAHNSQNYIMHSYETDAVKAVSSYQQKFNRSSFNMFDRLPSPTPSEESDDVGGDVGEVSSSSTVCSFRTPTPQTRERPVVSSNMESLSNQGRVTAGNIAPLSSSSNPTMKSSAKSRDPRLRFANSDVNINQRPLVAAPNAAKLDNAVLNFKKQKTADEPIMDGPAPKRQKNGLENSGFLANIKSSPGAGGWLEDIDTIGPQAMSRNILAGKVGTDPRTIDKGITTCSTTGSGYPELASGANGQGPAIGTNTVVSLPALLKDIAVNPAILLNILKMGQRQILAEEAQQKISDPVKTTHNSANTKTALGAIPLVSVTPSNVSGPLQKPAESPQVPSQISRMNKSGKICMKPRDPRRFLHGNAVKKSDSLGAEKSTANGSPTSNIQPVKDSLTTEKPEDQPDMKLMPHTSVVPSDIARQFTKNPENIANIESASQASTSPSPPEIRQNLSSQPVQTKLDRMDAKPVVGNSENQQNGDGSIPDIASGPSPHNSWGDLDLLFEGYDDKQKAAIQRERARRIEEQKKMFAARKLCLVLDLDHTLLNSAKFGEVDPVHDEILRKKEELDREKSHRHLFRFPHMGMWTKLRPGIWTFLERASKIFELHVYTMGNKVYAKEMAKILDPKGTLFAGRVISKGDDGEPLDGDDRVPKTKDMEGVLGMESGVLIIDDSVRVWPHHKLNLIVVERYTYFPCSRRQFGLPGPSLLEIDHDERSEDGTIASCLGVIERVHQNFFSHLSLEEVDVRAILASEQQKILANCRIVFSRVFPVGEANPHLHPLWQTAERFGAVCTNQIDEQVTHIVANSLGTDKVNWALSTGRFLVSPCWVEASALLYRRANEQDFSINLKQSH